MSKSLIIVESPAKIKTLKKLLGSQYILESSVGHIRDLPAKEFGVDVENNFEPKYETLPDKKEVIAKLKKAAKQCDMVYLASDPDREGEAISWHTAAILPEGTHYQRVTFNAITKSAVQEALQNPREIDMNLVNAQQARRLLDRLVGYTISPILNRRIQRGKDGYLSAGRVQSVALKLVVDREKEIEAFVPVEYWKLEAELKGERPFTAYLYSVDGKKVEKEPVEGKEVFLVSNQETAETLAKELERATYQVKSVEKKEKKRNPPPPFITSTLQQEASRHFGFSSSRTMSIAQGLYEGIDLGNDGAEGLITYMRTDSVRLAPEALGEAKRYIAGKYGNEYLPDTPRQYATKKSAQDAHEAIRPTSLKHPPEAVKSFLTREQFMLYQLIWQRFVACQMVPAVYDTVSADISADERFVLRATGSQLKFNGYLAVYQEKEDDQVEDDERLLPPLEENQLLELLDLIKEQSFTRPPPRFTEASLVKELEKSGIGRPSTYAAIMNKIQSRDYTVKESGRLKPTELGRVVVLLLENHFQRIMNIDFTANMEDRLELVAESERDWKELLRSFWEAFEPELKAAEKEAFVPKEETEHKCPDCGANLQKVWYKSKYFLGCTRYPDCNYTAPLEEVTFNKEDYDPNFDWEQKCPQCQNDMTLRHGRYGPFLGCSKYPDCKGIVNIPKKGEVATGDTDVACPAIGCGGHLVARRSRFGKIFYSCSTYPDCDVIGNTTDAVKEKYQNYQRKPYEKKTRGKKKGETKAKAKTKTKTKRKAPMQPPLNPSPTLQQVVGKEPLSRPEAVKKLWDYIKANNLQNPKDKRQILPDEKLAAVFDTKEPVSMFQVTGLLSKHLSK